MERLIYPLNSILIMQLKPQEIRLVINLCHFEDLKTGGWQDRKTILSKKLENERLSYTAGSENLTNYMNNLLNKGIIEERWNNKIDGRGRIPKKGKKEWRLKPTLENFNNLNDFFNILSCEEFKRLGEKENHPSLLWENIPQIWYTGLGKLMYSKYDLVQDYKKRVIKMQEERIKFFQAGITQSKKTIKQMEAGK